MDRTGKCPVSLQACPNQNENKHLLTVQNGMLSCRAQAAPPLAPDLGLFCRSLCLPWGCAHRKTWATSSCSGRSCATWWGSHTLCPGGLCCSLLSLRQHLVTAGAGFRLDPPFGFILQNQRTLYKWWGKCHIRGTCGRSGVQHTPHPTEYFCPKGKLEVLFHSQSWGKASALKPWGPDARIVLITVYAFVSSGSLFLRLLLGVSAARYFALCCAERAATSAMLVNTPQLYYKVFLDLVSRPWSQWQYTVYSYSHCRPPPCPSLINLSHHPKWFLFIPTCHLQLLKCSTNSLHSRGSLQSSHFPAQCPKYSQGHICLWVGWPVHSSHYTSTAAASESSISTFANNFDTLLLMHWFPLKWEKKGLGM